MAFAGEAGIFVSDTDLEHDLYDRLPDVVSQFTGEDDRTEAIKIMQSAKGNYMFDFLRNHENSLGRLADSELALPIKYCVGLVR